MLSLADIEVLLSDPILSNVSKTKMSKVHQCLIKGVTDDDCILANLRGVPHIVLYILKLVEDFTTTLRNIHYVEESPTDTLLAEYSNALKYTSGKTKVALQDWVRFVNIYAPFVAEHPSTSLYDMAVNQVSSSYVCEDTRLLKGELLSNSPLYWMNKPSEQKDPLLMRYENKNNATESSSCAATSLNGNLVAIGDEEYVFVHEMSTGLLLYELEHNFLRMAFTEDDSELLIVDDNGVNIYDAATGKLKWQSDRGFFDEDEEDIFIWMEYVGEHVLCGTERKVICFQSCSKSLVDTWSVDGRAAAYHYHIDKQWLLVGYQDQDYLKCWTIDGVLAKSIDVGGRVLDIALHLTNDNIIACALNCRTGENSRTPCGSVKQFNISTDALVSTVSAKIGTLNEHGGNRQFLTYMLSYRHIRLVCFGEDCILVCDDDGKVVNSVGIFRDSINGICLIPNTTIIFATALYSCYMYDVTGANGGRAQNQILNCCLFLRNGEDFVTLSLDDGQFKNWSINNFDCCSVNIEEGVLEYVVAHPHFDVIVAVVSEKIVVLETSSFRIISTCALQTKIGNDRIRDMIISNDGKRCLIVWDRGTTVYDISDFNDIKAIRTYKMRNNTTSDIHHDGERILVVGQDGVHLFNVKQHQVDASTLNGGDSPTYDYPYRLDHTQANNPGVDAVVTKASNFARFMYNPDRIVCVCNFKDVMIMDLQGVILHTTCLADQFSEFGLISNRYLVCMDEFVELLDLDDREKSYIFHHHLSIYFSCAAIHPKSSMIVAGNDNGTVYALDISHL